MTLDGTQDHIPFRAGYTDHLQWIEIHGHHEYFTPTQLAWHASNRRTTIGDLVWWLRGKLSRTTI